MLSYYQPMNIAIKVFVKCLLKLISNVSRFTKCILIDLNSIKCSLQSMALCLCEACEHLQLRTRHQSFNHMFSELYPAVNLRPEQSSDLHHV